MSNYYIILIVMYLLENWPFEKKKECYKDTVSSWRKRLSLFQNYRYRLCNSLPENTQTLESKITWPYKYVMNYILIVVC